LTTIALAGKGGTGKTTISALIIRYLTEERNGSILAIDADPSSNLNMVLGVEVETTVGDIREGMLTLVQSSGALAGSMPGGMSKHEYLDYQIQMALVEDERVDLLAMGRPEGPGCYCAANQMLRVNRLRGEMPEPLAQAVERTGLELLGTVPEDAAMAEFEFAGRPLVELPAETAVYRAVREIAERAIR